MNDKKLGAPRFVNISPGYSTLGEAAKKLASLREASAKAIRENQSDVAEGRQRRQTLIESISDRAMRRSLEKK